MLIVHGGGPTAVINASLYGAVTAAKNCPEVGRIYGARDGSSALLTGDFIDLTDIAEEKLLLLLQTPATAIGSSRFHLEPEDYDKMPAVLKKFGIRYLLFNGGNGSMDTCGKVYDACERQGVSVGVVGIPKTMDNDIAVTDHAPGFASAARYIAGTVQEIGADVKSLPIHVCIVEAMGRNAGWIAAASALARKKPEDAPHLIYLPERPFDEEEFLRDVKLLFDKQGGVVVVVSEGLKNKEGKYIVPLLFKIDRSEYFDDVSAYLRDLIVKRLGIKVRNEKPGLCGRASIAWQSAVDRDEAVLAGAEAAKAAAAGKTGVMVGFERVGDEPYEIKTILIPIEDVMLHEKALPNAYISESGNDVTEEFIRWCRPLIGELPNMISFKD